MTSSSAALGVFAAVCAGGVALGNLIGAPAGGPDLPALWPPTGVLVGALLLSERRQWATLLATASAVMLVAGIILGRSVPQATTLAVGSGVEGMAAAWLLRRLGGFSLSYLTHVWAFVCVAALVPMAGGVAVASLQVDGAGWFATWRGWWLMGALGMVLITPLVVAAATGRTASAGSARHAIEAIVVLVLAAATSVGVFGNWLSPLLRVPAYLLPFFLWSAFRLGVGGTTATVFLISFVGMWNTAQGRGPFALPGAPVHEWLVRSQGTSAIAAASFLLMAGAVADRKRIARENEVLVVDLQQALAEIKTLRGLIPICAWCHKVRDDAGFWQQIESYLGARTDATFSHSICPACEAREDLGARRDT